MASPVNIGLPQSLALRLGLLNRGAGFSFGLGAHVVPVVNFDPDRDEVSERLSFVNFATLGAAPGLNNHLELFNPASSGKVVFLDAFQCVRNNAAAWSVDMRFMSTAIANLTQAGFCARAPGSAPRSAAVLRNEQVAGVPAGAGAWFGIHIGFGAGDFALRTPPRPYRLDEGQGIMWSDPLVNEQLQVQVYYREYPVELAPE